jgi:hypothetical protein
MTAAAPINAAALVDLWRMLASITPRRYHNTWSPMTQEGFCRNM